MPERSPKTASPADAPLPSEGVRTAASLILFIHLFAIGLALIVNSASAPSLLLYNIRSILLRHLYWTWTDVGYGYAFTGSELEMSHRIDGVLEHGTPRAEVVAIVPADARGLRYRRYANMSGKFAAMLQNPEREGLLPSMVGGGVLKQLQDDSTEGEPDNVVVRCVVYPPKDLLRYQASNPGTPPSEVLYQARIRLIDGQGRVVEKFESRGQVAPDQGSGPTRNQPPATARPAGDASTLQRLRREPDPVQMITQ